MLTLFAALFMFSLVPNGLFAQSTNSGTEIKVRLLDRLDTAETQVGRTFSATVEEPVRLDRKTVLAKGATVKGTVTDVVSSGRLKRPASITLQLTGLGTTSVHTEPLQIDGKSHAVRNTELIGGGAAAGAILGGIFGGGKGAVIGTAAGASAGTGTACATGKKEIVLPSETELTFLIAGSGPGPDRAAQPAAANVPSYSWRDDPRANEQQEAEGQDAYDDSASPRGSDPSVSVGISRERIG